MDREIDAQELVDELAALGLTVHVQLAIQRILNRRLTAQLADHENGKGHAGE